MPKPRGEVLDAFEARKLRTYFSDDLERGAGIDAVDTRQVHPTGAKQRRPQIESSQVTGSSAPLGRFGGSFVASKSG